jgi:hypothetical protein
MTIKMLDCKIHPGRRRARAGAIADIVADIGTRATGTRLIAELRLIAEEPLGNNPSMRGIGIGRPDCSFDGFAACSV